MADGMRGMDRTPRADTRVRRNAQQLAGSADLMFSGALTVDGDGYIVLVLAGSSGLSQSVAGLTIDLDSTPGLVLGAGGIKALVQDVIAIDASGIKLTFGTGLQSDTGTLKTKDSEILHDSLSGYDADEHIDWTDATENLLTTGLGTFGTVNLTTNTALLQSDGTTLLADDGTGNLFLGADAFNNNSGLYNVGIGYQAGYNNNNTTGDEGRYNTYVGYQSGYGATSDTKNTSYFSTAMGSLTLSANTTGYFNTAMGSSVLRANTTGFYNSAMGLAALANNTTGSYNSTAGALTLNSNTTGSSNTAIGWSALQNNTTGPDNSAMGALALNLNITGYSNSAMGALALNQNTTGYYNSAMGSSALRANTTGYRNSAMGAFVLRVNTTGYFNSAMGTLALFNLKPTSKAVTVFADNGDGKTRVTSVGHGQSNGTIIQISGTTNYNGPWTIEQVAADTLVIDETFVADEATGWWGIASEGRRNIAIGAYAGYRQTTISERLFIDSRQRANAAEELTHAIIYGIMAAAPADQELYLNADVFLKADNRKIHFGAANDASIYYDGTDLWIDSHLVGTGSLKVGVAANHTEIKPDGDLIFVGTAGLPYGSCYGNHIGWSQANAVQNTWYNVSDVDMNDGQLHRVTHDGSGKLTVTDPGRYLISWSCCFEDNVANDHIEVGVEINGGGSAEAAGQGHLENKFASEEEHLSSSCIFDLADNATIEVAIRTTDAGTPTISIQAINITCTHIGGT